jgi:hypothetical protein
MAAEREGESAVCQRVKYPLRPKRDPRGGLSAQLRAIIRLGPTARFIREGGRGAQLPPTGLLLLCNRQCTSPWMSGEDAGRTPAQLRG